MVLQTLKCRRCRATLDAETIDRQSGRIRCRQCNAVYAIRRPAEPAEPAPQSPPADEVIILSKLTVHREADAVEFVGRVHMSIAGMIAVPPITGGLAAAFLAGAYKIGAPPAWLWGLAAVLAVPWLYLTLTTLLNRTHVRVDRQEITVQSRPLPWFGSKRFAVADVRQVFCRPKIMSFAGRSSKIDDTWELCVLDGRNVPHDLVEPLVRIEDGLFLKREIQQFLGIADRPVAGEVRQ